ncbi:hypothetical protein JW721_01170 [Candidatus Micrarchaeota archaeon]|nr:hypothetical protein [Candidatus Micrarchaeota archaeon]
MHGKGSSATLYYSEYDGISWSKPSAIEEGRKGASLPELAFSPTTGIFFLIWSEQTASGVRAMASGFSSGVWAPAVEIPSQKEDAVFDTSAPTNSRMGLGVAFAAREAVAVWETTKGSLYSSIWTPSGWSDAARYSEDSMPDAEYEAGGVPYSVFINGTNLYWSRDLYFGAHSEPVPGTGSDLRPALTFIGDGTIGLTVFRTDAVASGEIYFSRWDGSMWSPVSPIDPATIPGADRNPDVSPLEKAGTYWDFYFDYCGDGVLQWPNVWGQFEECEVGIACANPNEWCDVPDCLCYRHQTPDDNLTNGTFCGDGAIQRPNSLGGMEECEAGIPCANPNDACNMATCACIPSETGATHNVCSNGACISSPGAGANECVVDSDCTEEEPTGLCGNGQINAGEECDIGGALISGVQYGAAPDTCAMGTSCWEDCKCHKGVVTPRCGDGYISGPKQGANEECDVGGRLGSKVLPDTCPWPTHCSYICRCEEEEVDDGLHFECVEGKCMALDGEGDNDCIYDSQCWHYECQGEECVQVLFPGSDMCIFSEDCLETHSECINEECVEVQGLGDDECSFDSDCIEYHLECVDEECVEVEGAGQDGCLFDSDCIEEAETYCGDDIIQQENGEECEDDSDCHGDEVCSKCTCIAPPDLDCGYICGQTQGAELIASGLISGSACEQAVDYAEVDCKLTCVYSWFYKAENVAGYDSCCCGMVKRFDCTDCPGQNPQCPGEEKCNANAPRWWSPN